MMFYVLYALLPFLLPVPPAPGPMSSRTALRNLECERIDPLEASQRFPGRVGAPGPRGDYIERTVVLCEERVLRLGVRGPKDDAVLSELEERVTALAAAARTARPAPAPTWLVEVYYPSAAVSSKIAFATKNALMAQGQRVSDRTPTLAVGDVQVITRLPPEQAYPAACQRYHDNGSLGPDDALLAVLTLDPRETALHAGLCSEGRWTWLR